MLAFSGKTPQFFRGAIKIHTHNNNNKKTVDRKAKKNKKTLCPKIELVASTYDIQKVC